MVTSAAVCCRVLQCVSRARPLTQETITDIILAMVFSLCVSNLRCPNTELTVHTNITNTNNTSSVKIGLREVLKIARYSQVSKSMFLSECWPTKSEACLQFTKPRQITRSLNGLWAELSLTVGGQDLE